MDPMGVLFMMFVFGFPVIELVTFIATILSLIEKRTITSRGIRTIQSLGLVVFSTAMLLLATGSFESSWKGEKGLGWFGVINEGWAGATILPLWFVAAASLQWALIKPKRLFESKVNFLLVATLAAICGWYTFATLYLDLTGDLGDPFLAVVPAAAMVNLLLLMLVIWRHREFRGPILPFAGLWLAGAVATVWAKCVVAMDQFDVLPEEPECFVVTAAAQGSERFVASRYNHASGRMENAQLARLQAFERALAWRHPHFRHSLRRAYNRVGPPLARRIRGPLAANIAYVCLKPLEAMATIYIGLAGGSLKAKSRDRG